MNVSRASDQAGAGSSALRAAMARHPLVFFFLMSYAFSWIIIIPYLLSVWNILKGNYSILYMLKPFVGPTLAAISMTWITEGKDGLLHLRERLRLRHASLKWCLLILLVIPVLILFGISIQPGMQRAVQVPSSLVTAILGLIVLFVSGASIWSRRWAAKRNTPHSAGAAKGGRS